MKKALIAIVALSSLFFVSCKEEAQKPKVIYDEAAAGKDQLKKSDSTDIKVADLPVHMEGTKYLIHPVGDIRVSAEGERDYRSRTNGNVSYAISNYNRFEIAGYFQNLKFQHIDSTALRPLTDKKIQIQTATYLNTVADRYKKNILLYTLVDADTNLDGKVDVNDIKSLYISDAAGKGFKKLSQDAQELIDWNLVEAQCRIYFRTIEDINKNGAFDKNDRVHYHFVNLLNADWTVEQYEPVN